MHYLFHFNFKLSILEITYESGFSSLQIQPKQKILTKHNLNRYHLLAPVNLLTLTNLPPH